MSTKTQTPKQQINALVTGMIVRVMREGGFIGDIRVKNIRERKDGSFSATVDTSIGGGIGRATHRAFVGGGNDRSIRITRVTPVTIQWPGQPARQMG